jgi:hypothetical protein
MRHDNKGDPTQQQEPMTGAPVVIIAPTLAKLLELKAKGKRKLKAIDLARFLAAAQYGPTQGTITVSIPIEVIGMIGERLVTRSKYIKIAQAARVQAAQDLAESRRAEADKKRQHRPERSSLNIAGALASHPRQIRHFRRTISKSKK